MMPENIEHILELYKNRTDVDKECHLASFEEIEKNDFNLNIPRYVDSSEPEPEIDLGALVNDMKETDAEIRKTQGELVSMMQELDVPEDVKSMMDELIKQLEA